jgi:hypothetical protein
LRRQIFLTAGCAQRALRSTADGSGEFGSPVARVVLNGAENIRYGHHPSSICERPQTC